MNYQLLISLHVTTAVISVLLFIGRGIWVMQNPRQARPHWMNWLPHVNDSVLFILGIILMITIQQFPGSNSWLTAKLSALVIYILLGMVVMKWAKHRYTRFVAWLCALLVFAYMVGVAVTKQPLIFL